MKRVFFAFLFIFFNCQICYCQDTLHNSDQYSDTLYRNKQFLNYLDSITGYKDIWRITDDSISYKQDSSYLKIYQNVCSCMDIKWEIKNNMDNENFSPCLQKAIKANKEFVLNECQKKYGDTSEKNLYKFTRNLNQLTLINLVYYFDDYYFFLD